jgi:hypothetical protein
MSPLGSGSSGLTERLLPILSLNDGLLRHPLQLLSIIPKGFTKGAGRVTVHTTVHMWSCHTIVYLFIS